MAKLIFISNILALVCWGTVATANGQQRVPESLGWDLSYAKLFEAAGKEETSNLASRARRFQSGRITKLVAEWKSEPIISSVLIEWPPYHSNDIQTLWFVRTKKNAYFWEFGTFPETKYKGTQFDVRQFDLLINTLRGLESSKPREYSHRAMNWKGYYGTLSTFHCPRNSCVSEQRLLTWDDFYPLNEAETEAIGPGRIAEAVDKALAAVPALDLLSFRECKPRPTRDLIGDVFLGAQACRSTHFPTDLEGSECMDYRGRYIHVKYAPNGVVDQLSLTDDMPTSRTLAKIIPTKSWIGVFSSSYRRPDSTILSMDNEPAKYEDHCIRLTSVLISPLAASIPRFRSTLQWK
ncbi:MAG TPA: hypothetical protein PKD24_06515 [Pyrinomonadaceae bacterium]|nr:hypothetical protein [Pyrinomonadaceae bacterium]HMP65189.1 hypothetical protein [Pyrinomonadaceae bacterium]